MAKDTWTGRAMPEIPAPGWRGWVRITRRGVPTILVLLVLFGVQQAIRLLERAMCGAKRPITPHITVIACRISLFLVGIRFQRKGVPMTGNGALVANHTSWLDILTLNAATRMVFVSKSEVAAWPGIGLLARGTGTIFIRRDNRREAGAQNEMLRDRLAHGDRLLFFPEGTSTDGLDVLPFKSTLFQAFFNAPPGADIHVQPVSMRYIAPDDQPAWFYGWWGDMSFGAHLLHTLAASRQGRVEAVFHPPLPVAEFADRKTLAKAAETAVRMGHGQPRTG